MEEKNYNWITWAIVIALIYGGFSLFSRDKPTKSEYTSPSNYNTSNNTGNYSDSSYETENPYNESSGHSAGYEWAQKNAVSSCGGNSNSFIEGCEEYLSQQEEN